MALTMPPLKVEMAFGANFTTPLASMTWTDVSQYVALEHGIKIEGGRQDEFNNCDPNDISLTLRNDDGRFTPGLVSSPYYPNVVLYVPIRVSAALDGGYPANYQANYTGGWTTIFYGYVDDWPVAWPDEIDLISELSITAHSRMARLGVEAAMSSDLMALGASAAALYPLSESAEATQALNRSSRTQPPLTRAGDGSPTLGAPSITPFDDVTSAQYTAAAGAVALTTGGAMLVLNNMGTAVIAMSAVVQTAMSTGTADLLAVTDLATSPPQLLAKVSIVNGVPRFTALPGYSSSVFAGTASIADNAPHMIGLDFTSTYNASTADWSFVGRLWVDGAIVATGSIPNVLYAVNGQPAQFDVGSAALIGNMAYAALWDTLPSWSDLSRALKGYPGETTAARFSRIAQRGGVPAAEVSAAGTTAQSAIALTGAVLDALRAVEDTEGGVVWDRPDTGALALHARSQRYLATSAFTLDMAKGHVDGGFQPVMDGTGLCNDASVATSDGTVSVEVKDQASISRYGLASTSVTTYASDPEEPNQRAQWKVNGYKDPKVRVPSMSADLTLLSQDGVRVDVLVAAYVGSLFTVTNLPAQMGGGSASYFIEGWTDDIGVNEWTRTWNVSPAAPWLNVLVLDDPVRGVTDSTNILAY